MANWEVMAAIGIVALAFAVDWGLWRHHSHAVDRDLHRLSREARDPADEPDGGSPG